MTKCIVNVIVIYYYVRLDICKPRIYVLTMVNVEEKNTRSCGFCGVNMAWPTNIRDAELGKRTKLSTKRRQIR